MNMSGTVHQSSPTESSTNSPAASRRWSILYVLGGPGAGKGTLCTKLAQKYRLRHFSVGDVLRAERDNPESKFAAIIAHNMQQGTVGPMEITVELLKRAMERSAREDAVDAILIDGEL
jgi:UMP-CMP kinase